MVRLTVTERLDMTIAVAVDWDVKQQTKKMESCIIDRYIIRQGTNIFQYSTCPAGRVTYNFHSSCKHMHLSLKSICHKEHKGVICNMTSSSNSSQRTRPVGRVLWEELLVLYRFHL